MEKKIDPKLITEHAVTLTHREDLQLFSRLEPTGKQNADGKATYVQHHGARQMSGKLVAASPQHGDLVLAHEQFGKVTVSAGYHAFNAGESEIIDAAAKAQRHVDISLDNTGKKLTVGIDNGMTVVTDFAAPKLAYGLSDLEKLSPDKTIQGKLMAANAENTVELNTEKGPVIVYGRQGASSVTTLKKLVGKQVEVGASRDGKLQVKAVGLDKSKGL